MTILKKTIPEDFSAPTALPASAEQTGRWQRANRTWWNSNPMRYDWTEPLGAQEGSRAFYEEIDRRFFSELEQFMPWRVEPFDPLVDFEALRRWDMLEIGVGNGSHAGLFATNARSFTGIDLTEYAVKSTSRRLRCFGIDATILQMDAEIMAFRDNSFDFIWSWGVIHHSANTERVLGEMRRVLRPGGTAITMVYHRTLWNYYMMGGLIYRLAPGHPLRKKSVHEVVQLTTDGAIARFYSIPEWTALTSKFFTVDDVRICGGKAEVIPLPNGSFKRAVMRAVPDGLARLATNRLKQGTFLVSTLRK